MNRNTLTGIIIVIFLAVLAIIYFQVSEGKIKTYEGVYSQGYNVTDFKPCNRDEHWWLSFNKQAGKVDSLYEEIISKSTRKTFIRFTGKKVENSAYGHVGYYDSNLEVVEVDTLRIMLKKDCQ